MTSVCLIGNSHLAVLKLGWPNIQASFADMELDFYAAAGGIIGRCRFERLPSSGRRCDAKAVCHHQRKNGDIAPTHSAYVLCGLMLSAMTAVRAYTRRLAKLHSAGQARTVTDADFETPVHDVLRDILAIDVLRKLREITAAPAFLIATPLPAYERHPEIWEMLAGQNQNEGLVRVYNAVCDRRACEFGAIFLPQHHDASTFQDGASSWNG